MTTPGVHTINVWAREDGMYIDKIVLTTSSSYTPSGTGPVESVRGPVYVYDGNGNRVQAVEAGAVTAYVGSWYESITTPTGTTMKRYYYAGALRIAMREGAGADASNLTFLFGDHLGSTSVSYKADESLTKTQLYKVWGENRWPTTSELPTTYRFTGQRAETSLGIYFYNARWYDQWTGRFLQADSIIPNPGNPLDWDRYAYARNNALRYTDPTGHEVCDEFGYCYDHGKVYHRHIERPLDKPTLLFYRLPVNPEDLDGVQWFGATKRAYDLWKKGDDIYSYCQDLHCGLDFLADYGTNVYAGVYGEVIDVRNIGNSSAFEGPFQVRIQVGEYVITYGHMDGYARVNRGDQVEPDTVLGGVGQRHKPVRSLGAR